MQPLMDAEVTVDGFLIRSIQGHPHLWMAAAVILGVGCLLLVIANLRLALRGAVIAGVAGAFLFLWPIFAWQRQAAGTALGLPWLSLVRMGLSDAGVATLLAVCPALGAVAGGAAGPASRLWGRNGRLRPGRVRGVIGAAGPTLAGLLLAALVLEPYLAATEPLPPLVPGPGYVRWFFLPSLLAQVWAVALVAGGIVGLFRPVRLPPRGPSVEEVVTPEEACSWPPPPRRPGG